MLRNSHVQWGISCAHDWVRPSGLERCNRIDYGSAMIPMVGFGRFFEVVRASSQNGPDWPFFARHPPRKRFWTPPGGYPRPSSLLQSPSRQPKLTIVPRNKRETIFCAPAGGCPPQCSRKRLLCAHVAADISQPTYQLPMILPGMERSIRPLSNKKKRIQNYWVGSEYWVLIR